MKKGILLLSLCLSLFFVDVFGQTIQKFSKDANINGIQGMEKYDYYLLDTVKVIIGAYTFEGAKSYPEGGEYQIKIVGNFKEGKADGKWSETWVGLTGDGKGYKEVFISNFKEAKPDGEWIYTDTLKSKEGKTFAYNKLIIKSGKLVSFSAINSNLKTPLVYKFDANGKFNYPDKFINGFDKINYFPDIDTKLGLYYHKGDDEVYIVWDKYYVNLYSPEYSNLGPEMKIFSTFYKNLTYYCNKVITDNYYFFIGYGFAECNKVEMGKYYERMDFGKDTLKLAVSKAYFDLKWGIDAFKNNKIMPAKDYFQKAKVECKECPIKSVIDKKLSEIKAITF